MSDKTIAEGQVHELGSIASEMDGRVKDYEDEGNPDHAADMRKLETRLSAVVRSLEGGS